MSAKKFKPKTTNASNNTRVSSSQKGSDKKKISSSTSMDSSSTIKTEFKKKLSFKCTNPLKKKTELIQITVFENTKISQIIQQFNEHFEVNNIIGFKADKTTYNKENDILFMESNLNFIPIGVDIIITLNYDAPTKLYSFDNEQKVQAFYLIYFDDYKTAQVNITEIPSKATDPIAKVGKTFGKNKIVVYFPGGNMMTSSFLDFMEVNGKCKKFLYVIFNKSKFEPKEANEKVEISKKSIHQIFQEISDDYVDMICCILKYINMKLYKSLHIIKAFFETNIYIPFLTSLYHIYNNKVTKIDLFTIISFLQFYAPDTSALYKLFNTMSSYICQKNSDIFINSIDDRFLSFKHDFNGPPKKTYNHFTNNTTFNPNNPSVPIFITDPKTLRFRPYWSMYYYKTGLILLEVDQKSSKKSNNPEINYYDPNLEGFSKMKFTEIESNGKKFTGVDDFSKSTRQVPHGFKYSQGTVSIIDYSGSMVACIDEKGDRRSKIAINIINKFIQTGIDLSINDPFILLDRQCLGETDYPLDYESSDFLRPSLLYDRIKRTIDFMGKDDFKNKLTPNARKRILFVTDGQDTKSQASKYDILHSLLDKKIILDVIFLKEGGSTKDLCAISHLSGGKYFRPKNQEDAVFISCYRDLIDISKRKHISNCKICITNEDFDKMAQNMRVKNMINSIRIKHQPDFYDDIDLYSPFSVIDPIKDFQMKRIQKEIDICASYQLQQTRNGREPFFRIFRKFIQNTNNIDYFKAIVFLKGSDQPQDRVIHQVLVQFTSCYPFEMPMLTVLSKAKIDWPHGEFTLTEPYTLETRLISMLYDLNQQLKIKGTCALKDNDFDPINSLDEIRCVFNIYEGEKREIKSYNKYFTFK